MLQGVGLDAVKALTDSVWDGGRGMSFEEVGKMTLDQVQLAGMDRKAVRRGWHVVPVEQAAAMVGPDGCVRARAADGKTVLRLRSAGKSVAAMLRERAEAARPLKPPKTKRRGGR